MKWYEEKRLFCAVLYLQPGMRGRKKVTVYQIVDRLQEMEKRLTELAEQLNSRETESTSDEIIELRKSYEDMLKAILWMLDGAKYLWQGENTDSGGKPLRP